MKTPDQVAKALKKIYETEFGGKDRGRFRMTRQQLRELSGRGRLEDSTLGQIVDEAYELGFVVTDLGDDFSIVEVDVMRSYRGVPARVIDELA